MEITRIPVNVSFIESNLLAVMLEIYILWRNFISCYLMTYAGIRVNVK